LIKQVVDSREWVSILNSKLVQFTKVLVVAQTVLAFPTKQVYKGRLSQFEIQLIAQVAIQESLLERLLDISVQLARPPVASPST
ncbi:hypothetical protein Tco_0376094, partial [Tanacetum coccineum]